MMTLTKRQANNRQRIFLYSPLAREPRDYELPAIMYTLPISIVTPEKETTKRHAHYASLGSGYVRVQTARTTAPAGTSPDALLPSKRASLRGSRAGPEYPSGSAHVKIYFSARLVLKVARVGDEVYLSAGLQRLLKKRET